MYQCVQAWRYKFVEAFKPMDAVRNPFAPGAGSRPPELAGRDTVLADSETAILRISQGRHDKSQILLGLRGVGKTVLLNKIEEIAERHGALTTYIEAPEDAVLGELLYPKLHQILRKLSLVQKSKAAAIAALRALRSFAAAFKFKMGDISISVDPEPGVADSGILDYDLAELFVLVGQAAQQAGRVWTLLIDEVQYLSERELSALIVAIHRVNQKALPVIFFGAGLPQIAALAGDAKSYSERLFSFPDIGALDLEAAAAAIRGPVEEEEASITDAAIEEILHRTQRYPYFLQEWAFQAWNLADGSPIDLEDAKAATPAATHRLDQGFFRVRFDRLTPKEREYVMAMAGLGRGPYRSSDVAAQLGERIDSLGPRRASIIRKGMIYSPAHGDIAFTVPLFEEFLGRIAGSAPAVRPRR